jgi:hypothetical protein
VGTMKAIEIIDNHTIATKVYCGSLQYDYLKCIHSEKDIDNLLLSNIVSYVKRVELNLKGFEIGFDTRIVYLHNNVLYISYIDKNELRFEQTLKTINTLDIKNAMNYINSVFNDTDLDFTDVKFILAKYGIDIDMYLNITSFIDAYENNKTLKEYLNNLDYLENEETIKEGINNYKIAQTYHKDLFEYFNNPGVKESISLLL